MSLREIDYEKITKDYMSIINMISKIIHDTQRRYSKGSEEYNIIESDFLDWYGSSDKAYYRISDILDMSDFFDEEDFQYFALEKLSDARHRIESYIKRSSDLLDFNSINYKVYDDIVMDYYQPIRLSDDKDVRRRSQDSFKKYNGIIHRRIMINFGLLREIESVKESFVESKDLSDSEIEDNLTILNNIYLFATKLNGYSKDMCEE